MPDESLDLYIPEIDARNEEQLYQLALNVVAARSNGVLNDFSDHNPLGVLLRAQAFAGAELLYYANQLPLALVLKFLGLTGVERETGAFSTVELTVYLTAVRPVPFILPASFEVISTSGKAFKTDSVLTIPAGSVSGVVSATAEESGPSYNLPAFTITQITQPRAFLSQVVNTQPSQGGSAEESLSVAVDRGLSALSLKNPVSAEDFEALARETMGDGSQAKAIGLLAADRISEQIGAVHLFLLAATGEPANPALISEVSSAVTDRLLLGTTAYFSPMAVKDISGYVIAHILPGGNAETVIDDLWAAYQAYLDPKAYSAGETLMIQELRHALRLVAGIEFIEYLELNDGTTNVPMDNDYTLPVAYAFSVQITDESGNIISSSRGAGEPSEFESPD